MTPNPFRLKVSAGQQERIIIKSPHEIERMRRAGKITAAARALAGTLIRPGVTTQSIDREVSQFIRSQGAVPSFYRYNGFPASVCISVNEEVIHGIPGKRRLKEGDIVSVDVGALIGGYHGDCCATFPCGEISPEAQRLIDVTRQSFFEGIAKAREGNRLFDISAAVQNYVESHGYSIVREYVGHGVGTHLHEPPEVPNYVPSRKGGNPRLLRGMTIAVEPMVNAGAAAVSVLDNNWTVVTKDGKWAAHYENTILITDGEPEILTAPAI
ncbi:MAG: type I methionyl aminopeptidase [Oscillibacter sp.]|nr:type I methionyl aminopeptidase [Oscillibacter sp.]